VEELQRQCSTEIAIGFHALKQHRRAIAGTSGLRPCAVVRVMSQALQSWNPLPRRGCTRGAFSNLASASVIPALLQVQRRHDALCFVNAQVRLSVRRRYRAQCVDKLIGALHHHEELCQGFACVTPFSMELSQKAVR